MTDLERLHRAMLLDPCDTLTQHAYRDAWLDAGHEDEPRIITHWVCSLDAFLAEAGVVFARHPITEVVLKDREPLNNRGVDAYFGGSQHSPATAWHWIRSSLPTVAWELPDCLMAPGMEDRFPSEAAAGLALSRAALNYGRCLAGLPLLPVCPAPHP